MEVLYIFLAAILCATQAQVIPLTSPCQTQVVTTQPVVATTIIDNSVSNALANALQLLIVSNLIENTMNSPCGFNTLQGTVAPLCDTIPFQAPLYSPAIDVITPDYLSYLPFDPVISPCDIVAPCEPVIDIIPNVIYPEVIPNGYGCGCDIPFVPNFGCGNIPNIGCGCGCNNGYSSLANILPNILPGIGLPNIGCGCNNFGFEVNPFGPLYACDQCGPIVPEVIFPGVVAPQVSYGKPIKVFIKPLALDNLPANDVLGGTATLGTALLGQAPVGVITLGINGTTLGPKIFEDTKLLEIKLGETTLGNRGLAHPQDNVGEQSVIMVVLGSETTLGNGTRLLIGGSLMTVGEPADMKLPVSTIVSGLFRRLNGGGRKTWPLIICKK
ncbi:unnamed protein product [Arctia plantaginis]|uniref:Uncharacterized protein n=1 Tax=Arctia plantaginis TaxID=874455 RepID=A0A8S1A7R0_ARCPL|nr:unnamed protein product [Arctia plantaginis]